MIIVLLVDIFFWFSVATFVVAAIYRLRECRKAKRPPKPKSILWSAKQLAHIEHANLGTDVFGDPIDRKAWGLTEWNHGNACRVCFPKPVPTKECGFMGCGRDECASKCALAPVLPGEPYDKRTLCPYCNNHTGGGPCDQCGYLLQRAKERPGTHGFITSETLKEMALQDYEALKRKEWINRMLIPASINVGPATYASDHGLPSVPTLNEHECGPRCF